MGGGGGQGAVTGAVAGGGGGGVADWQPARITKQPTNPIRIAATPMLLRQRQKGGSDKTADLAGIGGLVEAALPYLADIVIYSTSFP